tara:strand:- start:1787 stop:2167 length:381 start_codon:yes stop_codon:yes gene_type:complete
VKALLFAPNLLVVLGASVSAIDSKRAQLGAGSIEDPYKPAAGSCLLAARALELRGFKVFAYLLAHRFGFLGLTFLGLTFFGFDFGRPTWPPYVPGPFGILPSPLQASRSLPIQRLVHFHSNIGEGA